MKKHLRFGRDKAVKIIIRLTNGCSKSIVTLYIYIYIYKEREVGRSTPDSLKLVKSIFRNSKLDMFA
jgi:hypothetical protein